ncbi:major histocompatibility complex class I-related gene protein-like [Hippocampus comes]|uniref:major histocompatibility complex class I-related gene protein-like n=1 Tax=Hippocampus comes TaxID=109280 RepID=UPI00094E1CAB|nr:PREDICTED: major histocompatibility complex class I-related gene protein-like [Hippocampus comes]
MTTFTFYGAVLLIHSVTSVMHTLKVFTTSSSQIAKLPEYWEATYVDGIQILQFDSNSRKTKAKLDWVNKITAKDPYFWEREYENNIANERVSKVNIEIAKERFNHTAGVHLIQRINGCEWDEETGEVDGWEHYSYDSEDFISFEPRTTRWIATQPQASMTKNKLDQNDGLNEYKKHSLTEICPFLLKNHVSNGRDFLMRTELPTVSLLQKTPSSPIACHAKGFSPELKLSFNFLWKLMHTLKVFTTSHEDVEMGQLLPNHDGTFQTTAHLKVEVTPDAEGEYECVFQLAGVQEAVVVKLDSGSILSNARIQEEEHVKKIVVASAVALGVLALLTAGLAVVLVKRPRTKQAADAQAPAPVASDSKLLSTSDSEPVSE